MIQIILAATFLAMIVTPAIIAATSGKKETEIEHDELDMDILTPAARRQMSARQASQAIPAAATLPMRGTLGMANR